MKDLVEVCNVEVARVLTDSTQVRLLEPFFDDDITLSDAAKELNIKLTTLLYHVTKFVRLGIVEVTKEEARKGKAVKYYRTTAKSFLVPFNITPSLSLKHLLAQLDKPSDDIFNREIAKTLQELSSQWVLEVHSAKPKDSGAIIALRRKDKPRDDTGFNLHEPAFVSSAGDLHLDFTTAKEFQKELRELLERYHKKQTSKGQLYFYRVGLTPVQDDSYEPKD